MISRNKIKFLISLQNKKVRDEEKLFVIEGEKLVNEFLGAKRVLKLLVAKPEFVKGIQPDLLKYADEIEEVNHDSLKQVSTLKTPHNALAVVHMHEHEMIMPEILKQLCIALELVQDPGNMGTIIRAAGWFGIKNIICSPGSVDVYNPKVIQASMGALLHVNVYYHNLKNFLSAACDAAIPVFGTLLEGGSIYEHKLDTKGVILFGNESKGISEELIPLITEKLRIPRFSNSREGIDSLNVGMAASIVFSEFMRRRAG